MPDTAINVKILGQERRDITIDLVRTSYVDYVSHGTRLTNCRLVIHGSARGIVFHGGTFTDCEFVAKRRFTGYLWNDVVLKRCRFIGEFDDCRFGPRPDVFTKGPHGAIEECDFSKAKLGWCEFYNCDASKLAFPSWPTFVIESPQKNAEEWMRIGFPDSYAAIEQRMICGLAPGVDVTGLVAVAQNAKHIAKQHRISTEAVNELISGHQFIKWHGIVGA